MEMTDITCDCCGRYLNRAEWVEYGDMCNLCIYEQTGGLIDDEVEEELGE